MAAEVTTSMMINLTINQYTIKSEHSNDASLDPSWFVIVSKDKMKTKNLCATSAARNPSLHDHRYGSFKS
jgi:hypothetical protein